MTLYNWFFGIGPEWWLGAWGSVVLPTAMSVWAVCAYRHEWSPSLGLLMVVTAFASILSGEWRQDAESTSLHLLPVFFIALAFMGYWKTRMSPCVAYAACFLSLVSADVVSAVLAFGHGSTSLDYLAGVGGAGLKDGLFVFPMTSFLLELYVGWRLKPRKMKTRSL